MSLQYCTFISFVFTDSCIPFKSYCTTNVVVSSLLCFILRLRPPTITYKIYVIRGLTQFFLPSFSTPNMVQISYYSPYIYKKKEKKENISFFTLRTALILLYIRRTIKSHANILLVWAKTVQNWHLQLYTGMISILHRGWYHFTRYQAAVKMFYNFLIHS